MSRTYRKKYVPVETPSELEYNAGLLMHSDAVEKTGRTPDGLKFYTTDYRHKAGCMLRRWNKNITRDGNKAHGDVRAMCNISTKKIKRRSKARHQLRHELNNMRAGNIEWDGNIHQIGKIRMFERARWAYDVFD